MSKLTKSKNIIILCLQILLPPIIIYAAILGGRWLLETAPKPQRKERSKQIPLVQIQQVKHDKDLAQKFILRGRVQPWKTYSITSQISGKLEWMNADLDIGRVVTKGTVLFRIEAADLRLQKMQLIEGIKQLEADLEIEKGEDALALSELKLSGMQEKMSAAEKNLLLRKPQLDKLRSRIQMEKLRLDQVKLNLIRCNIAAPDDLLITERIAELGQQVAPGNTLIRAINSKKFQLILTINSSDLHHFDGQQAPTAKLSIPNRPKQTWEAHFDRFLPSIDAQGLLTQVAYIVKDPLESTTAMGRLPLRAYVDAEVKRPAPTGCCRLPLEALRDNKSVWLMQDGKLQAAEIKLLWLEDEHFVCSGLSEGSLVVTTSPGKAKEGQAVELKKPKEKKEKRKNKAEAKP